MMRTRRVAVLLPLFWVASSCVSSRLDSSEITVDLEDSSVRACFQFTTEVGSTREIDAVSLFYQVVLKSTHVEFRKLILEPAVRLIERELGVPVMLRSGYSEADHRHLQSTLRAIAVLVAETRTRYLTGDVLLQGSRCAVFPEIEEAADGFVPYGKAVQCMETVRQSYRKNLGEPPVLEALPRAHPSRADWGRLVDRHSACDAEGFDLFPNLAFDGNGMPVLDLESKIEGICRLPAQWAQDALRIRGSYCYAIRGSLHHQIRFSAPNFLHDVVVQMRFTHGARDAEHFEQLAPCTLHEESLEMALKRMAIAIASDYARSLNEQAALLRRRDQESLRRFSAVDENVQALVNHTQR